MQTPVATYRIQFHKEFNFQSVSRITDYLSRLGISTIYASPIFKAATGSTHGYDVADPNQVNPEVGTPEEFAQLLEKLRSKNLNWLQDIVPNHMVFSSENQLLMDMLEKGYSSPYSKHFDIEWNHPNEALRKKLLVPFLGSPYHEILKKGELQFKYTDGLFSIAYYELQLPLRIESYPLLIGKNKVAEGGKESAFTRLSEELIEPFAAIASAKGDERKRIVQMEKAKQALWQAYSDNKEFKAHVDKQLKALNSNAERKHQLLAFQYFRLAYWRVASREINYRRFFNINQLISIRVEDPTVFEQTHQFIFKLLGNPAVSGVRIDHIDGLNDPLTYLHHLRERAPEAYVVVEKILEQGEKLPGNWPVQGTSGYDFLTYLNNLFCYHPNREQFHQLYSRFIGKEFTYEHLLYEKKKFVLERLFVGDLEKLFLQFKRLSFYIPEGVDILQSDLRQTLGVLLACFPVYRTYINSPKVSAQDRIYIEEALHKAETMLPEQKNTLLFLRKILLLEFPKKLSKLKMSNWLKTVMQFQQISGPLMAKGLEDTTFYIFNRLISLNEVGGDPEVFGISTEEFHQFNQEQLQNWPLKVNASATHDTKRGEDVRARINVLSEIPQEWEEQIKKWQEINRPLKAESKGEEWAISNEEYFLYQSLVGGWPIEEPLPGNFADRLEEYLLKSMKEAKVNTSWSFPDEEHEKQATAFARAILQPSHGFIKAFRPFQKKIAHYGVFNSLAQTVVKLTAPGVPDVYQGCEMWDLSFVDPDNRRPVDYKVRTQYLEQIAAQMKENLQALLQDLLASKEDGRIKLFTVYTTLQLRNQYNDLFTEGNYIPLQVRGTYREHIIAFAREKDGKAILVVVPCFLTKIMNENQLPLGEAVWQDTIIKLPQALGAGNWQQVFSGKSVKAEGGLPVKDILSEFPVGLLVKA
jgi:(1->4)-alpha-D-glucan 1-alpha-D-glucosylmutase